MGRRKLGRPKAGEETLTRERILATALRLVDEQGVEALSMRRLAAELEVDPMALYHHLPGKRVILAGVIELVFRELQVPAAENTGWQDRVRAFAWAYRNLARAHPSLVLYLVSDGEAAMNAALEANEHLYTALANAGLPPRSIIRAADLVVDYLNGFALAERSNRLEQPDQREGMLKLLDQHPPENFPTLRWVFGNLVEEEVHADFKAGLDILIAGIEALAGQPERSIKHTRPSR